MLSNSEKRNHNPTKLGSNVVQELKINQRRILIDSLEIGIPAPEQIIALGERQLPNGVKVGQLLNSKTLNYKKFTPHRDGLFCERIFGPVQSFVCACGKKKENVQNKSKHKNTIKVVGGAFSKDQASLSTRTRHSLYKPEGFASSDTCKNEVFATLAKRSFARPKVQALSSFKGSFSPFSSKEGACSTQPFPKMESLFCTKCQVEYISKSARRHRLGYIKLFAPVTHIWYLKGRPSYLSLFLGKRKKGITSLVYCNAYLVEQAYSNLEIQNSLSYSPIQPKFSPKGSCSAKTSFLQTKRGDKFCNREGFIVPQNLHVADQDEALQRKTKFCKPKGFIKFSYPFDDKKNEVFYKQRKIAANHGFVSHKRSFCKAKIELRVKQSKVRIEATKANEKFLSFRSSLCMQGIPFTFKDRVSCKNQFFTNVKGTFGITYPTFSNLKCKNEFFTKPYVRAQTLPFLPSLICPFHLRDSLISFLQSLPHTEDIPNSPYCHTPRRDPLCDIHKFLAELKSTNNTKKAERLNNDSIKQFLELSNWKYTQSLATEKTFLMRTNPTLTKPYKAKLCTNSDGGPVFTMKALKTPLLKKRRLCSNIVAHKPPCANLISKNKESEIINLRFTLLRLFSKRRLFQRESETATERNHFFTRVKTSISTKTIARVGKGLFEILLGSLSPVNSEVDVKSFYKRPYTIVSGVRHFYQNPPFKTQAITRARVNTRSCKTSFCMLRFASPFGFACKTKFCKTYKVKEPSPFALTEKNSHQTKFDKGLPIDKLLCKSVLMLAPLRSAILAKAEQGLAKRSFARSARPKTIPGKSFWGLSALRYAQLRFCKPCLLLEKRINTYQSRLLFIVFATSLKESFTSNQVFAHPSQDIYSSCSSPLTQTKSYFLHKLLPNSQGAESIFTESPNNTPVSVCKTCAKSYTGYSPFLQSVRYKKINFPIYSPYWQDLQKSSYATLATIPGVPVLRNFPQGKVSFTTPKLVEKFTTSYLRVNRGIKSKYVNKAFNLQNKITPLLRNVNKPLDLPFFLSGSKRNTVFFIIKKQKKVDWILNQASLLSSTLNCFDFIKHSSDTKISGDLLDEVIFRNKSQNFVEGYTLKHKQHVPEEQGVYSAGMEGTSLLYRTMDITPSNEIFVSNGSVHSTNDLAKRKVCMQVWSCVLIKTFLVSEQLTNTVPKRNSASFSKISLKIRQAWFDLTNSMNVRQSLTKSQGFKNTLFPLRREKAQSLQKIKVCTKDTSFKGLYLQETYIQPFAKVENTFAKILHAEKAFTQEITPKKLQIESLHATPPPQDEAFTISKWYIDGAKEILLYTGGGALESLLKRFDISLFCQFLFGEIQILRKYYKDQIVAEYNKDKIISEYNSGSSTSTRDKANTCLQKTSFFVPPEDNLEQVALRDKDKGAFRNLFCRRIYRTTRRLKIVQLLMRNRRRPEWMMISVLPVLPPDLRPVLQMGENLIVASDLNTLYQRVIYRNNRHYKGRFLDFHFVSSIHRLVQDAVDRLMENGKGGSTPFLTPGGRPLKSLSDILKGKRGRFRFNLLGKRVDFSGRSVIVVSPNLKIHECGLPREIALELYKYLLIRQLLLQKRVSSIVNAKKLIKRRDPLIWNILREIIYYHPLLLNRAPTLHRLGIQAFQPKLALGSAILLHPLVCAGFNADFDGDQMGVHLPLSPQARAEAWDLLWSRNNLLSPATGQPILLPSQDMVLGFYYMTALLPSGTEFRLAQTSSINALPDKYEKVLPNANFTPGLARKTVSSDLLSLGGDNLKSLTLSFSARSLRVATFSKRSIYPKGSVQKADFKKKIANLSSSEPENLKNISGEGSKDVFHSTQRSITVPILNKGAYNGTRIKSLSSKQINLPVIYVFSDQFQVVEAYQKKQIDIHTPIWCRWVGKSENEEKSQIPLELRMDTFGYSTQIYSTHKYKDKVCKNANIAFLSLYIRTTVGRVLVNNLIKKHT